MILEIRIIVKRSSSEVMLMMERLCFGIFSDTCSIISNFKNDKKSR